MIYDGSASINGFSIISRYSETIYVTHPMLAQIGRTGGDFPGIKGGGHGYGISSFCSFGRK